MRNAALLHRSRCLFIVQHIHGGNSVFHCTGRHRPLTFSPSAVSSLQWHFSLRLARPAGARTTKKGRKEKKKSSNQCITSIKQAHARRGGEQSPAWSRSRRRGDIERRTVDSSGSDRESRHVSVIKPKGLHNTARGE